MKNLKLLSLALVAVLSLNSCSDEDDGNGPGTEVDLNLTFESSDDHINTAALPQAILDYISTNYPNNTIWKAEIEDNNNYEVELNDETELIFDQQGNFLGIDEDDDNDFGDEDIAPASLPASIRDFISTYFTGTTIVEAERENNGNFEIELSNDVELIFDANGNWLGRADDDNDDADDEDIAVDDLPQAVRDYIATNYPDNNIIEAEREDDGTYEVTLNNGLEIKFDTQGNFLEADDHNGDDDDDDDDDDNSDD